ncbi:MAG: ParB/Srx family N-terminal domain-containing protein, partial [Cyanobacteria bacterium]|nr:ParB/Srx family N-terminal domain-containing protein [Cyanobacteriota bacterium]
MKLTKLSELKIVPLSLSEIRLPARSLKEHPERQLTQIIRSIESFGFNDPIAVDDQGEVIEGVGRFLAAQALKLETIPVIRLTHLTLSQKRAYRIAHNKICLNTGFDLRAL